MNVYFSSPTNSTFFTTCCSVAICDDQRKCPKCKEDVYPIGNYNDNEIRRLRFASATKQWK